MAQLLTKFLPLFDVLHQQLVVHPTSGEVIQQEAAFHVGVHSIDTDHACESEGQPSLTGPVNDCWVGVI